MEIQSSSLSHRSIRVIILSFFLSVVMFFVGVLTQEFFPGPKVAPLLKQAWKKLSPPVSPYSHSVRLPTLQLMLKAKHMRRIEAKRNKAVAAGVMLTSSNDYVPGHVRYKGKRYKAKLRLKGDWVDHLQGEKWSFRVQLRGDHTLFGMKKFSIQHPKTRGYLYEWLYHQALRAEDVLALRYLFVRVTLNDQERGIFALEEHFDKRLVESQQRREGVILRFNEDLHWRNGHYHIQNQTNLPFRLDPPSELTSHVDAFQQSKIRKNPTLTRHYLMGKSLLQQFREGQLSTSQLFDVRRMAFFAAISDLMGSQHSLVWHNLRFAFNPVTSQLEPIGFDGMSGQLTQRPLGAMRSFSSRSYKVQDLLFRDRVFFRAYTQALEKVTKPGYLENLLRTHQSQLKFYQRELQKEFAQPMFQRKVLYANRYYLSQYVRPIKGLEAYLSKATTKGVSLQLRNIVAMPLEVLDLRCRGRSLLRTKPDILLSGKLGNRPIVAQTYRFSVDTTKALTPETVKGCRIHYRLLGGSRLYREPINSWPHKVKVLVAGAKKRWDAYFRPFPFIKVNNKARTIVLLSGRWHLKEGLIIPKGYTVVAGPDVHLNLSSGASILSYSPLLFRGSAKQPIQITSTDKSGGGLVVIKASRPSIVSHVLFHNLGNPKTPGWSLTGAVTFYESPVSITSCSFSNNRSEDALNIIRSKFTMMFSTFRHTLRDAFDGDFVTGTLRQVAFYDVGNDAIDLSGSKVKLQGISIQRAKDKGISIGEKSTVNASATHIQDTAIAIAVKDSSHLNLDILSVARSKIGISVFQKKSEFAGGRAILTRVTLKQVRIPYVVEKGSSLRVNQKVIAAQATKMKELLYPVKKGKIRSLLLWENPR